MKSVFSFLKEKLTIQYRENKSIWNYVLDIVFNVCVYVILIIVFVVIVTFIGFGYAPINIYENPKAALDYVWPYGVLVLTIPLALLFIIPNIVNLIKNRKTIYLIASLIFFILLVVLNLIVYQLDLTNTIASWFEV